MRSPIDGTQQRSLLETRRFSAIDLVTRLKHVVHGKEAQGEGHERQGSVHGTAEAGCSSISVVPSTPATEEVTPESSIEFPAVSCG